MRLNPPAAVLDIARRLEEAGYETWAVGGAVRDAVLGIARGDWDLATRAEPKRVRRIFPRTVPLGIEHGTVGVISRDGIVYEVTTFRRDVETFGRHAVVDFAETIEEDLARRDFTINALAWHPLTGELRDPYGGRKDLADGVLRTVGRPEERFAEDYLRVLRGLRFAGHFGLTIEPDTWAALKAATEKLPELSAERVREELWKVIVLSRRASATLSLYADSGALAVLYPELHALIGLERGDGADRSPSHAPRAGGSDTTGDLWTESLFAVDAVPPSRPLLRIAALLHAVGMPAARSRDLRGGWRFVGHETIGARKTEDVMRRLKASNEQAERVTRLVRHHTELFPPDSPDVVVRRWLIHVGPDLAADLFRLAFALWRARERVPRGAARGDAAPGDLIQRARHCRAVQRARPPLAVADLAIGGEELRALGLEPGPEYGRILRTLLDRVIEEPELNTREKLLELVREEMEE